MDHAFRYGGDEFIVLFVDSDMESARKASEKLLKIIAATPVPIEGTEVKVTISGGAAALSEAIDANQLMDIADKRLYKSKNSGRNRITYE
jgi:diguanylate cyclase (GGDEF)-like protein